MSSEKLNVFDYIKSINEKDYLFDENTYRKKDYNKFVVNRSFSFFSDTILIANEMNMMHNISDKMHYDFMFNMIRKGKRYSKWMKNEDLKILEMISDAYDVNLDRAKEIRELLSLEEIENLQKIKGGKS